MSILEEAEKIEAEAKQYLDSLREDFLQSNRGKTIVVFPRLRQHQVVENAVDANTLTSSEKYRRESSFVFNL